MRIFPLLTSFGRDFFYNSLTNTGDFWKKLVSIAPTALAPTTKKMGHELLCATPNLDFMWIIGDEYISCRVNILLHISHGHNIRRNGIDSGRRRNSNHCSGYQYRHCHRAPHRFCTGMCRLRIHRKRGSDYHRIHSWSYRSSNPNRVRRNGSSRPSNRSDRWYSSRTGIAGPCTR